MNILIIDGSNLLARMYFGMNTYTSSGIHSGLVYGVLNLIEMKIRKHKIEKVYVCFDSKPYWRSLIFPEYKSGRVGISSQMGDNKESYYSQADEVKKILNMCFDVLEYETFEADDLIAAYTKLHKDYGNNVFIYSGDHDFLQLVDENVSFIKAKVKIDDELYTIDNFKELIGITPEEYLEVLSINGDPGDGIPSIFAIKDGLEGEYYWKNPSRCISEAKITKLIKFNKVENLLEGKINPVSGVGKATNNLFLNIKKENIENYKRNKKLVNLRNGNEKYSAIMERKNKCIKKDFDEKLISYLFNKYELNTFFIIDEFPYYSIKRKDKKESIKVNRNNFAKLLELKKL